MCDGVRDLTGVVMWRSAVLILATVLLFACSGGNSSRANNPPAPQSLVWDQTDWEAGTWQ